MKSRALLLSAIVVGLSVGAAQASEPDAQSQAAALLSSSYVSSPAGSQANASSQSSGDAQAQAAALLSGTRTDAETSVYVISSSTVRPTLDAQAHAASVLSGSRTTTFHETARTTATTQQLGDHPAVIAARTLRGVDPNTFLVAHPARLQLLSASPSESEAQPTDVHARLGR